MATYGLNEDDWDLLLDRIHDHTCLPFLGAGISSTPARERSMPTGAQLAESLAAECKFPGPEKWDLFRVCQYFSVSKDPHAMRKAIRDRLRVPNAEPTPAH